MFVKGDFGDFYITGFVKMNSKNTINHNNDTISQDNIVGGKFSNQKTKNRVEIKKDNSSFKSTSSNNNIIEEENSFFSMNNSNKIYSQYKEKKENNTTKKPLEYKITHKCGRARVGEIKLPHSIVKTPVFMPVATHGTMKGLLSSQINDIGCEIILGNTYHLSQRPGIEVLEHFGGLHNFMNWNKSLLTDSGGFQMVSLLSLCDINEEGVKFQSPSDGSTMLLTPERSMKIQNIIGADIMMALDDVVSSLTTGDRVKDAMLRTIRWIDRCIEAHKRPKEQNLFGIVQGGLDLQLRKFCVDELIKRDLPGYAIGGLSGGEDKNKWWKTVDICTELLPFNKPIYQMGVGYQVDIVISVALGVDMFDCVYPCRTARFGTILTQNGVEKLKTSKFKNDCTYINNMILDRLFMKSFFQRTKLVSNTVNSSLLTIHNLHYMMNLMKDIRTHIKKGDFNDWVKKFMYKQYPDKNFPTWVKDPLQKVGIFL